MFENMSTIEVLKLLAPLIIFQFGLLIYCAVDIIRKGVRNLNKPLWIAILVINLIGPITYLIVGRKRWPDDD
ncbi:MAG: Negative regulatory protein YxlE [Firmicutes bacterium ADurb.Bin419]|nr:MAG: Negative regulatory protein YxlE [Firmicutes bacterium ADurb.Bin419]